MSWLSRKYAVALIDDELARLVQAKLDSSPADPRRPALMRRIDELLDMRLAERAPRGQAA